MDEPSISVTVRQGWTVVHVVGDVDLFSAPAVVRALEGRVLAGETRLVLDLRSVPFLDLVGARALVAIWQMVGDLGGALRLAAPAERVLRVLTLEGLDGVFTIAPSVTAACQSD